jgi:hypothetical protein
MARTLVALLSSPRVLGIRLVNEVRVAFGDNALAWFAHLADTCSSAAGGKV